MGNSVSATDPEGQNTTFTTFSKKTYNVDIETRDDLNWRSLVTTKNQQMWNRIFFDWKV